MVPPYRTAWLADLGSGSHPWFTILVLVCVRICDQLGLDVGHTVGVSIIIDTIIIGGVD